MSKRTKQRIALLLPAAVLGTVLLLINQSGDPRPSPAASTSSDAPEYVKRGGGGGPPPLPPSPDFSIVFVIDSSQNMYPRTGPNYFDLAKEGIARFIELPGFPTDGKYQIAVIQFTEKTARGYQEETHWLDWEHPWDAINGFNATLKKQFANRIRSLRRSSHHSASLMEMGLREATEMLDDKPGERHLILLGTGEYRLPQPCPPDDYSGDPSCDNDSGCFDNMHCNRACHIRHFADVAKNANNQIQIRTVHVGFDWHPPITESCNESPEEDCSSNPSDCPRPTRAWLMQEITGQSANYKRIQPFIGFGEDPDVFEPGTARDIALKIADWFCDTETATELDGVDPRHDGINDLCDNCPETYNPHQRDCDDDGIGDVCQNWQYCSGDLDTDGDGVPDDCDQCEGGDDCLVADWESNSACDCNDAEEGLPSCCDCDHNGEPDPCQAARELENLTLPYDDTSIDSDTDGTPDYCEDPELPYNCLPAPYLCRRVIPSILEDTNPANDEAHAYDESFQPLDEYEPGLFFANMADDRNGWWFHGNPLDRENVQIGQEISSSNPPDLFLRLRSNDGEPFFVEGPGLFIPHGPCLPSDCAQPNSAHRAHLGEYGYQDGIIIDMEIKINNSNGTVYSLSVLDPSYNSMEDARRVQLQFAPNSKIKIADRLGPFQTTFRDGTTFVNDVWFTLRIAISHHAPYSGSGNTCEWNGNRNTVRLFKPEQLNPVPNPPSPGSYSLDGSGFTEELGRMRPDRARGIQLHLHSDNSGDVQDYLQLDKIRVEYVTVCEWMHWYSCDYGCVCSNPCHD